MQPEERGPAYLWDMREAARGVVENTRGLTFEQYEQDENLRLAIERRIEVIGEAAGRAITSFYHAFYYYHIRRMNGISSRSWFFRVAEQVGYPVKPPSPHPADLPGIPVGRYARNELPQLSGRISAHILHYAVPGCNQRYRRDYVSPEEPLP